jgi:cytochrome c oxidase assembly protein subunit 15
MRRVFRPLTILTLVFTLLVILAGSVVRTTESGMGCPDWPKCFGYYIPPTHPDQVNFHPNQSYTKGMMVIVNDTLWRATVPFKSGEFFSREHWEKYPKHDYAEFYVQKTWIEYINRLLGALLGVLVLGCFVTSFSQAKPKKALVFWSFSLVVLTGFQGWLGALVVSSNLAPVKITIHMFAALLLLAIIIWIVEISCRSENKIVSQKSPDVLLKPLVIVSLIFTLIQVYLGTQVRESIDLIAESLNHEQRNLWIEMLPSTFVIHRALSLLVLAVNAFVLIRAHDQINKSIRKNAQLAGILVLAEIVVGFSFMMFDMPKFLQPTHLMLACLLFAVQTKLYFVLIRKG